MKKDVVILYQMAVKHVMTELTEILMMVVMTCVKLPKQVFVVHKMVKLSMTSTIVETVSQVVVQVCVAEAISADSSTILALIPGLGNVQAPTVLLTTLVALPKNDVVIV